MHDAVFNNGGAQADAGIHAAIGGEIADAATIDAAPVGFEFLNDFHRTDFWRAGQGAGREAGDKSVERIKAFVQLALNVGHDVHDMAEAFDTEAFGDFHRAKRGNPANIVAAEIEQHQMLGTLFRVGEQFAFEGLVFLMGFAAPSRAGKRADGDDIIAQAHQDFRRTAHHRKAAHIKKYQERRGVNPTQRAVKGKRRQRERD